MKTQTFSFVTLKNIFLMCLCVATIALFSACDKSDDPDGPDVDDEEEQVDPDQPDQPSGDAITCAQAKEIALALESGATSSVEYTIVGYITDVFANISNNQQSFWMDDNKGTTQTVQAYWANLPDGVSAFVKDSKVSIKGKLMNFNKNGVAIAEMKNPTVTILEESSAEGGDDTPVQGESITCSAAQTKAMALEAGASTSETYTITGYITLLISDVSEKTEGQPQQSFWMADEKGTAQIIQAFYANVPADRNKKPFTIGSKIELTGKLMHYVNATNGTDCAEVKNGDVKIIEEGPEVEITEGGEITSAEAATKALELANGQTGTVRYTVTGYVTATDGTVNKNQQTFYMDDTKGSGKRTFSAYFANLPEGRTDALTVGAKVKMTGLLMNYNGTAEMKNGTLVVLEEGDATPEQPEEPSEPTEGDKGTFTNPYTCAEVIALLPNLPAKNESYGTFFVKGFIVGQTTPANGSLDKIERSNFSANNDGNGTSIVLATTAGETDKANFVPVSLPTDNNNEMRIGLSLPRHPEYLDQEVILQGSIEKYFGVSGVKKVNYAKIGDTEVGTKK